MKLQPPSVPVQDPLLAAVRRRHPDADLVLLPPEPAPEPADSLDDAQVAAAVDHVQDVAARVWARVGVGPDGPPAGLTFGAVPGTVLARSRLSALVPERAHLLDDLRSGLEEDGWRFRRPWGDVERLVGCLEHVELRATYAARTGVLLVVLTADPLVVGPERARELVGH